MRMPLQLKSPAERTSVGPALWQSPIRLRTAPLGPAFALPADAAYDAGRHRNWNVPGPTALPGAPHHTAFCWKAKQCSSWLRPPERQRAAVLQAHDLLAQQLVIHANAGYDRFQTLNRFVFRVVFAALQHGFASG